MRRQLDSDLEQYAQQTNEKVQLNLKQRLYQTYNTSQQRKYIYKQIQRQKITDKLTYPPYQNIQQYFDQRNLPNLDCISCGSIIFPDLSYLLKHYTKPFVIFQQDEINYKMLPSISAVANEGGGNIAIVKQYEKPNFIKKGLYHNEFYSQLAETNIQNAINQIYGRRFIEHEIKYLDIFRRRQQFAHIINIKVDQQQRQRQRYGQRGKIFSVKNYKYYTNPNSFTYNQLYHKESYILVKNYQTYQFQAHLDNRQMIESTIRKKNIQPICSCYGGFKEIRQNKFLQYKQINQQLYVDPNSANLVFAEICHIFLKYVKINDFPQIQNNQQALILQIHHHKGQEIIKDIRSILTDAKIPCKQWFPLQQLQKKLKKPNIAYYQIRLLTFRKIDFDYQDFKKRLRIKLNNRQLLFRYRLISRKILIRNTLNHYQIECLFEVLSSVFGFYPVQNQHYNYKNGVLEYMMDMDNKILLCCYLIAHLANKNVYFQ